MYTIWQMQVCGQVSNPLVSLTDRLCTWPSHYQSFHMLGASWNCSIFTYSIFHLKLYQLQTFGYLGLIECIKIWLSRVRMLTSDICLFLNTFIVILLHLSQFPPFPSLPIPSAAPTVNCHTIVHVHGSFNTCSLSSPFLFFLPLSPPPYLLVTFSLFYGSMSVVLFCSLVYFVN